MLFRKQVLVTILAAVWVFAVADGRFVRQKREFIDEFSGAIINGGMSAMQVVQDHLSGATDSDGDYTVNVSEEDSSERKKRQAEQMDPDMEEVQNIWQEMWQTMKDGAKKIMNKVAQSFEREAEQQQPEYEH